jgi:undecaprenyl-diphosphatase
LRIAAGGGVLIAAGIALGLLVKGAPGSLDLAVMRGIALPVRAAGLGPLALAITHFGDPGVRPVLIVLTGAFLLWRQRVKSELVLLGGTFASILLTALLKGQFGRVRPHIVPWLDLPTNASFPSGHSSNTMAILLLFALLSGGGWRTYVAVAVAILVGLTRIVLGVHWPSDVLGGWLIGAGVALTAFGLARYRMLPSGPDQTGTNRSVDGTSG